MTTTIKFVRVERDCGFNKTEREDAATEGRAPRPIYDFDVMVDGEKRAQMQRYAGGKGYRVQDANGDPVDPPLKHYRTGREVDSKSDFLTIVSELLEAGKIPTLAQLQEKREAAAQARRDKIAARKEENRKHAISAHAVELYDALKKIRDMPHASTFDRVQVADSILTVVDAQAAEWIAAVDADPGRFGIY